MWFEIILILLGGIFTLSLSVKAVIDNKDQEEETKKYQKSSEDLQQKLNHKADELKQKTDEIIRLNEELRIQSDSHSLDLKRMTKPIPEKIVANFYMLLDLPENELEAVAVFFENNRNSNIITAGHGGNKSEMLSQLLVSSITINLTMGGEKARKIELLYSQQPIRFSNGLRSGNGEFTLSFKRDLKKVSFDGWFLDSYACNSNSHTLYDFENFKVTFSCQFGTPENVFGQQRYISNGNHLVKIESLNLQFYLGNMNGFQFSVPKLDNIDVNKFQGSGQMDLS